MSAARVAFVALAVIGGAAFGAALPVPPLPDSPPAGMALAPRCESDDGAIPEGYDVCVWPAHDAGNHAGRSFIASVPDADGNPTRIDYTWNGTDPIYVPAR